MPDSPTTVASAAWPPPIDPESPRDILHRLEAALDPPKRQRSRWLADVVDVLDALGACLEWQADADAAPASLLTEIGASNPRMLGRIQRLRRDHEELRAAVTSLRHRVNTADAEADADVAEVRDRLSAIGRRHRLVCSQEADVIHGALAVDLGVGD